MDALHNQQFTPTEQTLVTNALTAFHNLCQALPELLTHGTLTDYTHLIEDFTTLGNTLDAGTALTAYQLEKEVFRHNENRGIHLNDSTRGAASIVALARKQSPHSYRDYLKNCRILSEDTPYINAQYSNGNLTEAQVKAILTPLRKINAEHRTEFDTLYQNNPTLFNSMGPKQISSTVERYTLKFESHSKTFQIKEAGEKRYIRFRRTSQGLHVNGLLPLVAGAALQMNLRERSFKIKKSGDPRTREQIKADLFSTYLLDGKPDKLPLKLHLQLIMTDRTLLVGDQEPAFLEGYGYIPAQHARELVLGEEIRTPDHFHSYPSDDDDLARRMDVEADIRRLYLAPGTNDLVTMESKARFYPKLLGEFIKIRDRHCRTPYCDGQVEEIDHVRQHALGGRTDSLNADGRCGYCNKAKELPGWIEVVTHTQPHSMRINPGTGAEYQSLAPPASGVIPETFPKLLPRTQWLTVEQLFQDNG